MDEAVGDEVTPVDAIDSIPLRNKESEHSLTASTSNMLEAHEMITPCEGDHRENSNHMYTDILSGKSLDRIRSSEHASVSPRCTEEDAGIMVEELTLRKYNSENLPIVGTSSNRDRVQTRQTLWQHLYQIAGGSFSGSSAGEAEQKDKGWATSTLWEDMGYTFFPGLPDQDKKPSNNEVKDPMQNNDGISDANNASMSSGGIRTKILSKSGFSEYFIKSSLKGKGVICKGPPHRRPARESMPQIFSKSTNVAMENSDAPLAFAAETVQPPSTDIAELFPSFHSNALSDGINLREWLKAGHNKVNKSESLHIFRQIVELVDLAHSQGVVLQDLRPSCIKLLQSNQVVYTGSSVYTGPRENTTNEDANQLEMNKKRPLESNAPSLVSSCSKKPKYGEGLSSARRWPQFSSRSGFKAVLNISTADVAGSYDSRNDSGEEHDAKSECKSNSKYGGPHVSDISQPLVSSVRCMLEEKWYTSPEQFSERVCTFSSNIYCLGVLLFELLGSFDSGRQHAAAMLDLRHRILPPGFLSEHPREAGFCLWLLHPEPSSRPTTRAVLQSEVISGVDEVSSEKLLSSISEGDAESELLLHFLSSLKEHKEKDASKLVAEIGCIEADIEEVTRRQLRKFPVLSFSNKESITTRTFAQKGSTSSGLCSMFPHTDDKDSKLTRNIRQLESAYFSTRSSVHLPGNSVMLRSDTDLLKNRESNHMIMKDEEKLNSSDHLGCFFDGLCKYARYSKFRVRGLLRSAELNYANVICSLSFDRDEDYLAAGGVSKKIKIFEFHALFDDSVDIHYPVVEMPNKSKLSCICWNNYIRNYLASTDYDGVVKLWDASTGHAFTQFAEHDERAWSVDFSQTDPTKLASGSDDRMVKLWSLNERNSLCTIKNNANVCCVQFSADSAHLLAFSSADYRTYCYDLRKVSAPWCILAGHQKTVSYAKFLDAETIITASTDNTLKIWDLNKTNPTGLSNNACILTLRGHTNEKNFVGLSVADGYIACGSETNEVFTYYKSLPMPIGSHKFGSIDPISGKETDDDNGQFVSSVCWRRKSDMVVAANSSGSIKLLEMA